MPKLYFYDAGLVSWLLGIRTAEQMITHPLRGYIFETFIISELVKSWMNRGEKPAFFFWRDSNGNEADLRFLTSIFPCHFEVKLRNLVSSYFLTVFSLQSSCLVIKLVFITKKS